MLPTRMRQSLLAVVGISLPCSWAAETAWQDVLDVGDRNQVFIDGHFLAKSKDVRIVVCPPRKTNEKCLVGGLGAAYSSLVKPEKGFRWYNGLTKDGIRWRKVSPPCIPEPDNILGIIFSHACVFEDPRAQPKDRYKMFDGLSNQLSVSSDGFGWRPLFKGIFPPQACYPHGMDSHNICFYDTRIGKYVAYVRVNKVYECPPERVPYFRKVGLEKYGAENRYARRLIGRSVTDNLSRFPMPEVVLEPDERDPIFGGVKIMDFYCPQVVQYPYAQDAYFLFNCRFRSYEEWYLSDDMTVYPRGQDGGIYSAGAEDIELGASRDGIHWHRYDRMPWIRQGPEGSFDSATMYMTRGMFLRGDEIWMYYVGLDDAHTGRKEALDRYTLSRVVLRKDGFTCVEASYPGGEFTTPPMTFKGGMLVLNIETSAVGLARVEIQDEAGNPIPGYALAACDRIHTTNSTKRAVTWRRKCDVEGLSGRPIRLRFELLYGTRLYAFRFGKPE